MRRECPAALAAVLLPAAGPALSQEDTLFEWVRDDSIPEEQCRKW